MRQLYVMVATCLACSYFGVFVLFFIAHDWILVAFGMGAIIAGYTVGIPYYWKLYKELSRRT